MRLPGIIVLLVIIGAGLAHAQSTACEQNCCINNGGSWVSGDNTCDIDPSSSAYSDYSSCVSSCPGASSGSGCCGSALVLGLIGMAALRMR